MGGQGEGIKGPTRHLEGRRLAVRGGQKRCEDLAVRPAQAAWGGRVELDKRGPCASERGEKKRHG
jgi:hypothetical protein